MREILFRGKRKDNDEWVEGNYGEYYNGEKNRFADQMEALHDGIEAVCDCPHCKSKVYRYYGE